MTCTDKMYLTGNDVCSNKPQDLSDNARVLDAYVNSGSFYVSDRFGIERLTLSGLQNKVDGKLEDLGDDMAAQIDAKIIAQGGVEISQEWGDSDSKVLSQAFLTNNSIVIAKSMIDLLNSNTKSNIVLINYFDNKPISPTFYAFDKDMAKEKHNGGTIVSPTVEWSGEQESHQGFLKGENEKNVNGFGCWVAQNDGEVCVSIFGVLGDGLTDDTDSFKSAVLFQEESRCKLTIPEKRRVIISSPIELPPCFNLEGKGASVQLQPILVSTGGVIFQGGSGFYSESGSFFNIGFDAVQAGSATAFYSGDEEGYISQMIFENCTFYSRLRFAFNAPIVLNRFYNCDFGSYPGAYNNFTAFRTIGSIGLYESNANSFYSCVFRKSSAPYQIAIGLGGVQWCFYSCDFEKNKCSQAIIRNNGAGSITMMGGYVELNETPYFIRSYGDLQKAFSNLVTFKNVHLNNPATIAVLKKELKYPQYELSGMYGRISCALTQDEEGALNQGSDVLLSFGNHIVTAAGGSTGDISIETANKGYNTGSWKVLKGRTSLHNSIEILSRTISSNNTRLCKIYSSVDENAKNIGGMINITAFFTGNPYATTEANCVNYILNVSNGVMRDVSVISETPEYPDGSSIPNFNWGISEDGYLLATHRGGGGVNFSFIISTVGAIFARE